MEVVKEVDSQPDPTLPAESALPPGWEAVMSDKDQRIYYWNKKTGDATWKFPEHEGKCTPVLLCACCAVIHVTFVQQACRTYVICMLHDILCDMLYLYCMSYYVCTACCTCDTYVVSLLQCCTISVLHVVLCLYCMSYYVTPMSYPHCNVLPYQYCMSYYVCTACRTISILHVVLCDTHVVSILQCRTICRTMSIHCMSYSVIHMTVCVTIMPECWHVIYSPVVILTCHVMSRSWWITRSRYCTTQVDM